MFLSEDYRTLDGASDTIVWHRSVPDGPHAIGQDQPLHDLFPPLLQMIEQLQSRKYVVHLICCMRDHFAMFNSQVERQMAVDLLDAARRTRAAYEYIFQASPLADSLLVASYDSLVLRPKARRVFVEGLGLTFRDIETVDGTAKWYF